MRHSFDYLSREALFSEIARSTVYLLSTCIHARAKEEEEKKTHKSCISQFQVHFFTTLQSPIRAFATNGTERAKPYCAGEDN